MNCQILPTGSFGVNCAILWADGPEAWIVDPGDDARDIVDFLEKRALRPAAILCTHGHFDHIGAIGALLAKYPALPVHVHPADEVMFGHPMNAFAPDYPLQPRPATLVCDLSGGEFSAGGLSAEIIHTPGHTRGSVSIYFPASGLVLTGDTLFAGSCGRTDFPGGSMAEMTKSLRRLAALPPETSVIPGHGPATTIGRERTENPFLIG